MSIWEYEKIRMRKREKQWEWERERIRKNENEYQYHQNIEVMYSDINDTVGVIFKFLHVCFFYAKTEAKKKKTGKVNEL